jgi:carbon monoxide dehydrogenase subunit G
MTVRVTRSFTVALSLERVWDLLSDPEKRAEAISVVDGYEYSGDGEEMIWYLSLPVPGIRKHIEVRTRDIERDPPNYVQFEGHSRVMDVMGEHDITDVEGGSRIENQFVVEGSLPGVERFFKRSLDSELDNIRDQLVTVVEDPGID